MAFAPSDEFERVRQRLQATTFPSDTYLEAIDMMELLASERLGSPHAIEPLGVAILELASQHQLETRMLGTLAPGLRGAGIQLQSVVEIDECDSIGSAWLHLAQAVVQGNDTAERLLSELDAHMRTRSDLGNWAALFEVVRAEICGTGLPLRTPLSVLEPQTDQYIHTATSNIDQALTDGDISTATDLAHRSALQRPDSSALAARCLRLGGSIDELIYDPVVLTLYGERAWRSGDNETAVSAFRRAQVSVCRGPKVQHTDSVWVLQLTDDLRLTNEATAIHLLGAAHEGERFEGYLPVDAELGRLIYHPH